MIITVKEQYAGLRLDKTLQELYPSATFGLVQKLCRKGQIRIDGKRVKGNERLTVGQEIKCPEFVTEDNTDQIQQKRTYQLSKKEAHEIENMILYEDDKLVVMNKDYGIPVQAGSGHSKSLDRMLVAYAGDSYSPKLVHRIDKTTTGLVLFAKNKQTAREVSLQFKNRKVEKTYLAVVKGRVRANEMEGVIKSELAVEEGDEGYEKMSAKKGAQKAETYYEVLESAGMYHLVKIEPKTGRKHQIRVHMSSIGLPLVGDLKYDGDKFESDDKRLKGKLFLHAYKIKMPSNNLQFNASLPEHFKVILKLMQWNFK